MIGFAATFLAASVAAADEGGAEGYPLDAVLAAFATACSTVEDPAVNRASIEAAGWEAYHPEDDSVIGRMIALGREMVEDEELEEGETPTQLLQGATYRREVDGRPLHIVLSAVKIGTIRSTGCRLYDLDVPAEPDLASIENWARRAPDTTVRPGDGLLQMNWNGGLKPGHFNMEIQYVRPGAELPFDIPFSGLVFSASNMEIDGL